MQGTLETDDTSTFSHGQEHGDKQSKKFNCDVDAHRKIQRHASYSIWTWEHIWTTHCADIVIFPLKYQNLWNASFTLQIFALVSHYHRTLYCQYHHLHIGNICSETLLLQKYWVYFGNIDINMVKSFLPILLHYWQNVNNLMFGQYSMPI